MSRISFSRPERVQAPMDAVHTVVAHGAEREWYVLHCAPGGLQGLTINTGGGRAPQSLKQPGDHAFVVGPKLEVVANGGNIVFVYAEVYR